MKLKFKIKSFLLGADIHKLMIKEDWSYMYSSLETHKQYILTEFQVNQLMTLGTYKKYLKKL